MWLRYVNSTSETAGHFFTAALTSSEGSFQEAKLGDHRGGDVRDAGSNSHGSAIGGGREADPTRRDILAATALGLAAAGAPAIARGAADGQLIWGVHVSLAPV